jgi:MATE family multidrug resistance protein
MRAVRGRTTILTLPPVPTPVGAPGWRRELNEILGVALPLAGAQLAYMVMGTTDSAMMGRISTDSLAAGGLGSTVAFMMVYVALGLLQSIQPIVAQGRGAGDTSAFGRTLAAGIYGGILLAVPIVLILVEIDRILSAIGEPPEIAHLALVYERAFAWAVPVWLWNGALRNYLSALGHTGVIMIVSVVGCAVNLALNWMLIFGHLGVPALGLAGSGYATSIVGWSMGLALAAYAAWARLLPTDLFRLRLDQIRDGFREVTALGLPIAGMWLIEIGLFSGSSLLMGRFGSVALAAHQICLNLCALTYMVPFAISTAATVRVGFHIGAKAPDRARVAGFTALALGVGFMVLAATSLCLFARPIFGLYLDAADPALPAVEALGSSMLVVAAIFQVFDGTQVVTSGALRGIKDVRMPLLAGILGYWVLGLPLGAGLAFGTAIGPVGLWWGFAAGLIVVAILLASRFRWKIGRLIAASGRIVPRAA